MVVGHASATNDRAATNHRAVTELVSFDGGHTESASVLRPDRFRAILDDRSAEPRVARGGGYSYAAASFGDGSTVLDMARFDRVLAFDPASRTIEVEPGLTLRRLLELTAPAGLWLPVQPGYPEITVGGCVAANVHGKNPYSEGTFRRSVLALTLFHPAHGVLRLDATSQPDLFELTCGGYGLTGVILSATLRLESLPGPMTRVTRTRIESLHDGLERVRADSDGNAFAYTWHEGTTSPRRFGRGFMYTGTITSGALVSGVRIPGYRPITARSRADTSIPIWGRWTIPVLATGFRWSQRMRPAVADVPLFDAMFPFARKSSYFRLFGRRGLAEVQVIVAQSGADGFLAAFEREALHARAPLVMMSMKLFRGTQSLLRFEADGVCFTVNLMRSERGRSFLDRLDRLTIDHGGLPHIIKDSRLPAEVVRRCYPGFDEFRARLHRFDPGRVCRTEISRRLGL